MSRYFASIARQIGRGTPPKPNGPFTATNVRRNDPLDLEEVVMVTPEPTDAGQAPLTVAEETRAGSADPASTRKTTSVRSDERGGVVPERPPVEYALKQDRQTDPSKPSKRSKERSMDRISDGPGKEETVLVNAEGSRSEMKADPRPDQADRDPKPREERKPTFFEETSEIIEGRPTEPDEVRTIVLREVQAWVAAVPEEVAPAAAMVRREDPQPERYREEPHAAKVVVHQKETVTSVAERRSSPETKVERERQQHVEEHFELSIGTISVTIEGDERPPAKNEAAPQPPHAQNARTERSASSRLDRSYL